MAGSADMAARNEWVSRVLGVAVDAGGGGREKIPPNTGAVAYAKARLAWLAARKQVQGELDRLKQEVIATFEEDGDAARHADGFAAWVSPVLENFDTHLADTLDEAINTSDPAKHGKLVDDAKKIMKRYESFLASPLIAKIESNPFCSVAISAPISRTLGQLSQTVR